MINILYISYDGLTDPLGGSQILPYLKGLTRYGYTFTVVSLEKKTAFDQHSSHLKKELAGFSIDWKPVNYDEKPGLVTRFRNNKALKNAVDQALQKNMFNFIHARSYPASLLAMRAARKYGLPFVFDMRGFWADERVDGGIWQLHKPQHKFLYRYFKRVEKKLLKNSKEIISLTQAAKDFMAKQFPLELKEQKITVIPCCADLSHFNYTEKEKQRETIRKKLNISGDQEVMIYLGSIGTWYLLPEMIDLFSGYRKNFPDAVFLLVTQSRHDYAEKCFHQKKIAKDSYRINSAQRDEVPAYINAADVAVYFIKPAFSKMASSPVKLAEFMGCGLPVIANAGIGDVDYHAKENHQLILVNHLNTEGYTKALNNLNDLNADPEANRRFALSHYSLEKGVELYHQVYQRILKE